MTLQKEKAINQEPKIIDLEQLFGAWQNPENRQILGSYLRKHQWDDVGSVVKNLNNLMGYVQNTNFSAEDMMGKAMQQLAGQVDDDIMADMLRERANSVRSKQNSFEIPDSFKGLNDTFAQALLLTQVEWRRTGVDAMGLKIGAEDGHSRLYIFWQKDNVMTHLGMFDASDLILKFNKA